MKRQARLKNVEIEVELKIDMIISQNRIADPILSFSFFFFIIKSGAKTFLPTLSDDDQHVYEAY